MVAGAGILCCLWLVPVAFSSRKIRKNKHFENKHFKKSIKRRRTSHETSIKNRFKIHQKSFKNQSKSMKMVPGSGSKPSSVPGPQQRHRFLHARHVFGATWSISVDFGTTKKSKVAPKTIPKNQYGDFWASGSDPGSAKNRFWRR